MPAEPCRSCNGTRGWADAEAMDWVDCPDCAGTGKVENSITANEAEPLHLTLEEGIVAARRVDRVLVPEFGEWSVFALTGGGGQKQRMERLRTCVTWRAALEYALGRPVVACDDTAELVEALRVLDDALDEALYSLEEETLAQQVTAHKSIIRKRDSVSAVLARVRGET